MLAVLSVILLEMKMEMERGRETSLPPRVRENGMEFSTLFREGEGRGHGWLATRVVSPWIVVGCIFR